jgi:FixJ family two-component response regulator
MGNGSLGNVNVGRRGDGSHAPFGRNMAAPRNALLLHSAGKEGNSEMTAPTPFVFVIDDDESVRKGLKRLLRSANYESEVFKSASDFLARPPHPGPACVIVDVQMPGINGIDFQQALIQRRREEQLVFITGHGTIPMCTRVMKAGAVDFLPKPFNSRELLKCVEQALHRSAEQRRSAAERNGARRLLDLLTPREFEVMQLVITGMLNKQVGGELGVAEKTIKVHRGRLMQKLGVTSVAELVKLAQKAGVPPPAMSETKV